MRGLTGSASDLEAATKLAHELDVRDAIFPNVLESLRACLAR
jgi:hypothetical protein